MRLVPVVLSGLNTLRFHWHNSSALRWRRAAPRCSLLCQLSPNVSPPTQARSDQTDYGVLMWMFCHHYALLSADKGEEVFPKEMFSSQNSLIWTCAFAMDLPLFLLSFTLFIFSLNFLNWKSVWSTTNGKNNCLRLIKREKNERNVVGFLLGSISSNEMRGRTNRWKGGSKRTHISIYSKLLGWADGCFVGRWCLNEKLFQKKGTYVHNTII